ncbi:cell division protein ZapA [uncultured Arcticibacterium sp.]|uniref:cell division protein ZapA n=1 Tax=uncultured Arcticibacterium sp. TaxID=2173042 RepID=UPI0030F84CBB
MESEKIKANIRINGEPIPFLLSPEEEPYFREAAIKINDRLAVLHNKYGAVANFEDLLSTVAVEAMVDALQAHKNYEKLRNEVNGRLEQIDSRLDG